MLKIKEAGKGKMQTDKAIFIIDEQIIQNENFQVFVRPDLPWTEEMKAGVYLLTRLFDDKISFAVIGEGVYAPIFEEERGSFQKMSKIVKENCRDVLQSMPDFVVDEIDDNIKLITMNGAVFSFVAEANAKLPEYLLHRQKIIECCDEEIIYGFVMGMGEPED